MHSFIYTDFLIYSYLQNHRICTFLSREILYVYPDFAKDVEDWFGYGNLKELSY